MTGLPDDAAWRYRRVRAQTEALVEGLTAEDMTAQAMPEASPAKWHLAHTTWFFETFLLARLDPGRPPVDPAFRHLFNSYYDTIGDRPARQLRGLLTRPGLAEVRAYRAAVDSAVIAALAPGRLPERQMPGILSILDLGLAHEEQHQELILTDGLALFAASPLEPAWKRAAPRPPPLPWTGPAWVGHEGGEVAVGHGDAGFAGRDGAGFAGRDDAGFAYDNERPRHRVLLRPFRLAARPVTCGQWLVFMAEGGYRRPLLWQDDGWALARARDWQAPGGWAFGEDGWTTMTLAGRRPVEEDAPVCHVSWYEADAFARWAGARLPREAEWEALAAGLPIAGNLLEQQSWRPLPAAPAANGGPAQMAANGGLIQMAANGGLAQMYGDVWEWTGDAHRPYPGWRPPAGAAGEYNGKFMVGRMVLRGGSFATPTAHLRPSTRNFWQPETRWQFTGLRLAEDA